MTATTGHSLFRRWRSLLPLLIVVGGSLLFQNSCSAGIIVPAAADCSQDQLGLADESRVSVCESEIGAGETTAEPVASEKAPAINLADYMAADMSGCGAPTIPTGGGSSGWLAASESTEIENLCVPNLSERLVMELTLSLPSLAPSELLDPPRAAG